MHWTKIMGKKAHNPSRRCCMTTNETLLCCQSFLFESVTKNRDTSLDSECIEYKPDQSNQTTQRCRSRRKKRFVPDSMFYSTLLRPNARDQRSKSNKIERNRKKKSECLNIRQRKLRPEYQHYNWYQRDLHNDIWSPMKCHYCKNAKCEAAMSHMKSMRTKKLRETYQGTTIPRRRRTHSIMMITMPKKN